MYQRAWKLLLERLAQKTSWGRNELKELMLQCLIDAEEDPPQYVMCGTCGCIGLVGNCAYCEARTFPPPGELEVQVAVNKTDDEVQALPRDTEDQDTSLFPYYHSQNPGNYGVASADEAEGL